MLKEFLSEKRIPYREFDVTRDQIAAQEAVRISGGQNAVPVTVIDGQVVVGFNRERIEQLFSQRLSRPAFGAAVADAAKVAQEQGMPAVSGAYIRKVRPGTIAERMRLAAGDVILSLDRQTVADAAGLARALGNVAVGSRFDVILLRDGKKFAVTGIMH